MSTTRRFSSSLRLATAALVLVGSSLASSGVVRAVATTHYVAASGSVGANSSCSSPGYVGATHASIQAAVNAASSGDTIRICSGTFAVSTRLNIAKSLTITGNGAALTVLDGGGSVQIMIVQDNNIDDGNSGDEITVNINSLTFRNGYAQQVGSLGECEDGNRCGGGLFAENESRVNVTDVHFKDNRSNFIGGGFARFLSANNYPNVPSTINSSTFEGNTALLDGGAIATLFGFGLTVNRSTFHQNGLENTHMARSATAVIANFANATINDSTIVDHDAPSGQTVLYGDITLNRTLVAQLTGSTTSICNGSQTMSGGRANLVTDGSCTGVTQSPASAGAGNSARVTYADLKLGAIGYHGYDTRTIPLFAGSAALNYWTGGSCTGTDQRGISVPQGASCDVGAYERHASQGLNTPTTWSYGSTPLQRNGATVFPVVSGSTDPAGQGVTYASTTTSVCTVNASTGALTAVSTGTCTLTASAPTHLQRDADSTSLTLTIVNAPATTTTASTTTSTTVAPSTTAAPATTAPSGTTTTVAASQTTVTPQATTPVVAPSGSAGDDSTATTVARVSGAATTVAPAASTTVAPTTTTTVPAPDAPDAAPGEAGATVDGEEIDARVERTNNALVVSAADVTATVYGMDAAGGRVALDADGNLRLDEGDSVVVEATGYEPGSEVEIWLRSTPVQLGVRTADASGAITGKFPVPASVQPGDHRVILAGLTESGSDSVLGVGLRIGAYGKESGLNKWLIILPLVLATMLALVIPTTARRRKRANG
ncbi:MAG: choice-of-anchor Q domain-containing protein [Actinomycetota bacterium]